MPKHEDVKYCRPSLLQNLQQQIEPRRQSELFCPQHADHSVNPDCKALLNHAVDQTCMGLTVELSANWRQQMAQLSYVIRPFGLLQQTWIQQGGSSSYPHA